VITRGELNSEILRLVVDRCAAIDSGPVTPTGEMVTWKGTLVQDLRVFIE
jgi:hypothetical protein